MKKLFLLFIAVILVSGIKAENYRIDSVYHYFSINEKPEVSKTIYYYNAAGQKIKSYSQSLFNGRWSKGTTIYNEYNSEGLLTTSTEITEINNGTLYIQEIYTYNGKLVTYKEKKSRRDSTEWKILEAQRFEYNQHDSLIQISYLNGNHKERRRDVYLYDSNGNKVEYAVYEWLQEGFIPGVRTMYRYDTDNLLIQEKTYLRDKLSEQTMYEYNAKRFLVQEVKYIEYNGNLHPFSKCTYVNNADGKPIKRLLYTNIGFKGEFVLQTKQECTYDTMNNLTSNTNMAYIQGTWYPMPNSDERWIYYFTTLR